MGHRRGGVGVEHASELELGSSAAADNEYEGSGGRYAKNDEDVQGSNRMLAGQQPEGPDATASAGGTGGNIDGKLEKQLSDYFNTDAKIHKETRGDLKKRKQLAMEMERVLDKEHEAAEEMERAAAAEEMERVLDKEHEAAVRDKRQKVRDKRALKAEQNAAKVRIRNKMLPEKTAVYSFFRHRIRARVCGKYRSAMKNANVFWDLTVVIATRSSNFGPSR